MVPGHMRTVYSQCNVLTRLVQVMVMVDPMHSGNAKGSTGSQINAFLADERLFIERPDLPVWVRLISICHSVITSKG